MIRTIRRYIPLALLSILGDLAAVLLAPIAALFVRRINGREHTVPFWQWITTHDAPIDTYTHARGFEKDKHWVLGRFTFEQIQASRLLRYISRVVWIWRNPAYRLDHWMGYDQTGVAIVKHRDEAYLWDTGWPNTSYWTAVNSLGEKAFLWERQIYFYKTRCLELQFGWKLYRNDPDKRCMLAMRITPFKSYPRAVPKPIPVT